MKILIIGMTKLKYMPYANIYLENLNYEKNSVKLIVWERDQISDSKVENENIKCELIHFVSKQKDEVAKITKLKSFWKYHVFLKKYIKEYSPDKIIFLHTLSALITGNSICKKYNGSYVLDYRDYTFEKYYLYRKKINNLIKHSQFTMCSSRGFYNYFKKDYYSKIFIIHNLVEKSFGYKYIGLKHYNTEEKIKIGFWGFIRQENINKRLIDMFKNDNRFELHYYGREERTAINLKSYVEKDSINNVYFHGSYAPDERYEFCKDITMVHNFYEADTPTKFAMGNKYYDGIILGIPQLCNKETYMGQVAEEEKVGLALTIDDIDFKTKIKNYMQSLSLIEFKNNCGKNMEYIFKEHSEAKKIIRGIGD